MQQQQEQHQPRQKQLPKQPPKQMLGEQQELQRRQQREMDRQTPTREHAIQQQQEQHQPKQKRLPQQQPKQLPEQKQQRQQQEPERQAHIREQVAQQREPDRQTPTREHVVQRQQQNREQLRESPQPELQQQRHTPTQAPHSGEQLVPHPKETHQQRQVRQEQRLVDKICQLEEYALEVQRQGQELEKEIRPEEEGPVAQEETGQERKPPDLVAFQKSYDKCVYRWGLSHIESSEESESSDGEYAASAGSVSTFSDLPQRDVNEEHEEHIQGEAAEKKPRKRYYYINAGKLQHAMSENSKLKSLAGMTVTDDVAHFMTGAMEQLGEILYERSVTMLKTEDMIYSYTESPPRQNWVVKVRHLCKAVDTQMHLKSVFEQKILEFDPYCSFYVGDMSRHRRSMCAHDEFYREGRERGERWNRELEEMMEAYTSEEFSASSGDPMDVEEDGYVE